MSHDPSDFKFSLAVGAAGAYVEVTNDVLWDNSISRSWGTQNQFTPVAPGTFSFTLDNRSGKYSPDNPNSTLATLLAEGTGACWSLNGQLRSGQVRALQPVFTDIGRPENSAQMRVTVTDMLGIAALVTLANLGYSQVMGSNPYLFWPLNDPVGSGQALEATGNGFPLTPPSTAVMSLGVPGVGAAGGDTQMQFTGGGGPGAGDLVSSRANLPFNLPAGSLGFVGAWVTPVTLSNTTTFGIYSGTAWTMGVSISQVGGVTTSQGYINVNGTSFIGSVATATVPFVGPALLAVGATYAGTGPYTYTFTLYINGVAAATNTTTSAPAPPTQAKAVFGQMGAFGTDIYLYSHFWYAPTLIHEEWAGITTEANRLMAIDQTSQLVTLGTLPTDLSPAPFGNAATSGQSAFDALNAVVLTEQGYIDTTTAGTLTAPVQTIRIRARNRPVTPAATFAVAVDLSGAPTFARALNDEISLENVTGSNSSTRTVINQTLVTRVGSANASDTILTFQQSDLYEWGSDRIWRGIKRLTDITSITLDARGGSGSSLWNTLTSLKPGDRISITGLPSDQLGYATWDGFLIGGGENHIDITQSQFTLYLSPATPNTMVWDTDLWANGGNNTISTALTSGATSMLCTSADVVTLFETSAMNYYLQIDSEVVKVTACSAPVAGVQTLTIVRAQLATTAAAHAVGAAPEVYADSTGRLNNAIWAF